MKKYCLATTALEEFWDKSNPMVYLGEWCLVNKDKYWREYGNNADVMPYIWNDSKRLWVARLRAKSICESVLSELSMWLNHVHGESHDVSYWRIVIGPFLVWYVESLLDRYETLENTKNTFEQMHKSIYLIGMLEDCYKTPSDIAEFIDLIGNNDAWNVQIYTQLCSYLGISVDEKIRYKWDESVSIINFGRIKRVIRILLERISFYFQKRLISSRSDIIIIMYWLPVWNRMKIFINSGFRIAAIPYYLNRNGIKLGKRNNSIREKLKHIKMDDPLASIVMQTLAYNLPMQYLETYREHKEKALELFGTKRIEMAVTDVGHFNSCLMPMWLAWNKENGSKLVIIQHGGGYGDRSWDSFLQHELKISDCFMTWGWKGASHTTPFCNFKGISNQHCNWKDNKNILLVGTGISRFPSYLPSAPLATQFLDYINWQCRFIGQLNEKECNSIVYRKYRGQQGWREEEILLDNYPKLAFDENTGDRGFAKSLKECRIFVGDNLNTTFLEALSFNVPTILFWDTNRYESKESVEKYYSRLRAVGIFHDSPEAAAKKINEVYDDLDDWWLSDEVQSVRQEFCHQFARVMSNKEDILIKTLLKLL